MSIKDFLKPKRGKIKNIVGESKEENKEENKEANIYQTLGELDKLVQGSRTSGNSEINKSHTLDKKDKFEYYELEPIQKFNAQYNVIIGERSNGKTFRLLKEVLQNWWNRREQGAYIRRWREDFIGKRGKQLFEGVTSEGIVEKITDGQWTKVVYNSSKWYLARYDSELDKDIIQEEPFCFAFSLSEMEHDKSISFPYITSIVFDEFLSKRSYLPDEFVLFMNVISTIVRQRDNVTIYMLANTVNKYCPYFKEMGLYNVKNQEDGTIDLYNYGESGLKVAVERCASSKKSGEKKSNVYFAFDNPSLQMITGGSWELDLYPHCPVKFSRKDIRLVFFLTFSDCLLQCEVVNINTMNFLYIHEKTSLIQKPEKDIIVTDEYSPLPNYFRNIRKGSSKFEKYIAWYFKNDKVFYQDNEIGEVVSNYLKWCLM